MSEFGFENASRERIKSKERQELERIFAEKISSWHDTAHPTKVGLVALSALPYGLLIKRVWKHAYPNEEQPKFFMADPHQMPNYPLYDEGLNPNPVPSADKLNKDDVVIIFDEYTRSRVSKLIKYDFNNTDINKSILSHGERGDWEIGSYNLFLTGKFIKDLKAVKEVWLDGYSHDDFMTNLAHYFPILKRKSKHDDKYGFSRKTNQDIEDELLDGSNFQDIKDFKIELDELAVLIAEKIKAKSNKSR